MTSLNERAVKRTAEMLNLSYRTTSQIAQGLSREQLTGPRDGPAGWTVLEVICHLRDIEVLFHERLQIVLASDEPVFPHFDHEALVSERRYNEQELATVLADWHAGRERFSATMQGLNEQQLLKPYTHPLRGPEQLLDLVLNSVRHDLVHLEQITRILNSH